VTTGFGELDDQGAQLMFSEARGERGEGCERRERRERVDPQRQRPAVLASSR